MRHFTRFCVTMITLTTAVLAGCGGAGGSSSYGTGPVSTGGGGQTGGGTTTPTTGTNTINLMDNNSFNPTNLAVPAGTTVTWKWPTCSGDGYSTCVTHNVTFDDGTTIHSETQSQGDFSR